MSQEAERLTDTQFSKGDYDGSNKDLDKAKEAIQVSTYKRVLLNLDTHEM